MKKYFILAICILVSLTNCKKAHCNRGDDNFTNSEKVLDTLSNTKTHKKEEIGVGIWLDSTIQIRQDTIFFSYKVINNTSKNLLFYRIQALDIKLEEFADSDFPKCSILIFDSNHKLPKTCIVDTRPRELDKDYDPYSYILLRAGESHSFDTHTHWQLSSIRKDF